MFTDQKDCGITASHRDFLLDRFSIAGEFHTNGGAGSLAVRLGDIAVGRDGEGELFSQVGNGPHDRSLSNGRHFDSNRVSPRLCLGEMADQGAFDNVLGWNEGCLGCIETSVPGKDTLSKSMLKRGVTRVRNEG